MAKKVTVESAPPDSVRRVRRMWTAKHEDEVNFNLGKRFDSLCDGVFRGSIRAEELSDELLHLVVLELRRRSKAPRRSARHQSRAVQNPDDLRGRHVFAEQAVVQHATEALLREACRLVGATWRTDRAQADVFVTIDPLSPGQRTAWHCSLTLRCERWS